MGWLFSDPPPRGGPQRRLWQNVYETSRDSYERTIEGYEEADARKTATAAVKGWANPPRGLRKCPDPQPRTRFSRTTKCHPGFYSHWPVAAR